jgi:hypothetical protein
MVGRQLVELVSWYDRVYLTNTVYTKECWHKVIENVASTDEQGIDLAHYELYTVALPRSTLDRTLVPCTFKYGSSHTITRGVDVEATHELVQCLYHTLASDFAFVANFEEFLLNEQAECQDTMENMVISDKIVVIGASHCGRLCSELQKKGIECIDLSTPGWMPTTANISKLEKDISEVGIGAEHTVTIDLLSNCTFRYEQYDGTMALPYKSQGKYHMGGKVGVCSRETLLSTIASVKSVFALLPGSKIVLTPLPRYLYSPCCSDINHCVDMGTSGYIVDTIESTIGLRKVIQEGLVKNGITKFVVPDVLQQLLGEKSDFKSMGEKLRTITGDDGVHLTMDGYAKLADTLITVMEKNKASAAVIVSGAGAVSKPGFFWRGFMSPNGSQRVKPSSVTYKQSRSGAGGGKWRGSAHQGSAPTQGAGRGRGVYRTSVYKR